jgi:hypothetical protein
MTKSAAEVSWQFSFQLSPIIFTGGIANLIPGGALPIVLVTETASFVQGILSGGADLDPDDFFAHFEPLPGSKLASNQYPTFPLGTQQVAANARVKQPLSLGMRMVCPARGEFGWAKKLATMQALAGAVELHAGLGGSYTVATPSQFYANLLLEDIVDTSHGDSQQRQNTYQWNFFQPLIALADAAQAQSNLLSRISAGLPVGQTPSWSGLAPTVANPTSLGSIGTLPASTGAAGAQTMQPATGVGLYS